MVATGTAWGAGSPVGRVRAAWRRRCASGALVALAGLSGCAALLGQDAGGSVPVTGRDDGPPPAGEAARGEAARGDTSGAGREPGSAERDRTAEARTYVYNCATDAGEPSVSGTGDRLSFVARIEGETAWLFLPGQTVSLPHLVSASGARYGDGQTLFWSAADEARLEWQGQVYSGCRNDRRAAIWEHAKLNGVDFRAVGQEPGWHLEIRRADSLVLVSDYGTAHYTFPWSEPVGETDVPRTTYALQSGKDVLKVVLETGPCVDTMSGEEFETAVTLWLNGRQLRGCGRALH